MKTYSGINIQYPISRLLMDGSKTVETRTYPIPEKYLNKELLFIETPGRNGSFEARIVGKIKFSSCFEYPSPEKFYEDIDRHKVDSNSSYAWKDKSKWGWIVSSYKPLKDPVPAPKKKGICFTKDIKITT